MSENNYPVHVCVVDRLATWTELPSSAWPDLKPGPGHFIHSQFRQSSIHQLIRPNNQTAKPRTLSSKP